MSTPTSHNRSAHGGRCGIDELDDHYDVTILGGGITGLTLALQLTRSVPDLRVLVTERQSHPVREAAHKVGESSVEIQAHYLRDILGLGEHLEEAQLHKFGLRMFFSHGDNTDIARRVEYGQVGPAPLPSYQLDRGRLENTLARIVADNAVDFVDGCTVADVGLQSGGTPHELRLQQAGGERILRTRWVVDATGRASLLKRKLGLAREVAHRANASWFRIEHPIDVDSWSDDEEWRGRVTDGNRRLSTNHLMGPGYWVWLIPLASGATSVGIVAEAESHEFNRFNRFDRALAWLHEHEPQCAQVVEEHRDQVLDFRVMKDYAYGCEQVYSADRWCLTGEAGVSIDPLYSSGGDLMAISNGLITDLVTRDRRGEDITDTAQAHNQLYLLLSQVWLVAYENQYPLMGNPQTMVAKVIWDTIVYWAFPGLLFFQDKLRRLADSPAVAVHLYRCWSLHTRVQGFLREWHEIDSPAACDTFADPYSLLDFIVDLHNGMAAELTDDELDVVVARNGALLEYVAGQLVTTVLDRVAVRDADPVVARRIAEWKQDGMLAELVENYRSAESDIFVDSSWITLGHHDPTQALEVAR